MKKNKHKEPAPASLPYNTPRIKVCGMTDLDQMHQLGEIGVQFAGMIFYHKSPRFIMKHLKGAEVKREKLKIFKIGVFVNARLDEIMNQVDNYGLDMVQLHGDETPYFCEQVANYITVIKAFRIVEDDQVDWKVKNYVTDTDMFLFDTDGAGFGGTGKKFNWDKLKGLQVNKPFFLSGGIGPADTKSIKKFLTDPVAKDVFAIDINSQFEIHPGFKNMKKVDAFYKELNEK
jgi:phosphoribosylanthranilate isomerase